MSNATANSSRLSIFVAVVLLLIFGLSILFQVYQEPLYNWLDWPLLQENPWTWVLQKFGLNGLLFMALLMIAIFLWTNWKQISKWPGVNQVIDFIIEVEPPASDPLRFTVAIAHLDNDENHTVETLIRHELNEFSSQFNKDHSCYKGWAAGYCIAIAAAIAPIV